jgi:predicted nucleotidyltransferase component of viral defense system
MLTTLSDMSAWVNEGRGAQDQKRRKAAHILLYAIASSNSLNAQMAMKGGFLLAIKYKSSRHTIDVDFSTQQNTEEFNAVQFLENLENSLQSASNEFVEYGLECRIQSFKKNPPNPAATMPTYNIVIGYAYRNDINSYKRLQNKQSIDVLKIDYSLNEPILNCEMLEISNGHSVMVYSLSDLIAEKYRAILQQKIRNRNRNQDVYDLYYLITNIGRITKKEKCNILESLIKKSKARELDVSIYSITDQEIIKRSEKGYQDIQYDIEDPLPPFSTAFKIVKEFYESLPWKTL